MDKNRSEKILQNSIITYLVIMVVLFITKPTMIYDHKKRRFKQFGFRQDESIFALPVTGAMACIIIYVVFILYALLASKLK